MRDTRTAADAPAPRDGGRVKVLFPLPLYKAYDYLAETSAGLAPGVWVRARFGPNRLVGVVWPAREDEEPAVEPAKLKPIEAALDAPPLAPAVMDFVDWVAAYTMFPRGSVLRLVMRSGDALAPPEGLVGYRPAGARPARMTPQREAVLAAAEGGVLSARALAAKAGASESVVRALAAAGALAPEPIDPDPPFPAPDPDRPGKALSPEQQAAARRLIDLIAREKPRPVLLDGVTGAGKTEVYLEAVAAALRAAPDAQALVMLPEIALTLPFLKRIAERFGAEPAAWHSDLGAAQRRRVWRRVLDGSARLVVGARSALFLPYRNLRLIVVDEEHEAAYKQEDGVIYQARDMAVARGALGRFPVVLASATPSLETVVNVDQGRYEMARLEARYGGARLPDIALVDMRREPPEPGRWLSPPLAQGVDEALAAGGQALLFLNRRGYAPLTICRRCGSRMKAPDSDTWLVEHRFENRLVCHHTGFSMPKPEACPVCNAVGALVACGPGVERVAEEAAERWPQARRAVLSSDAAGPAQIRAILDAMRDGEIDILIATQLVAKGHHFPNLVFVGVVDADMGLAGGDLRAAERTYQLLSQVAGRAGRAERPGRALLQSFSPDAPVLQALASGDRDLFLAAEAESRRLTGSPPYGRFAAILLRSRNEALLKEAAERHRAAVPRADGAEVWGPAPAPIYRLRGETRMRFLVKTRRDIDIQAYVRTWLKRARLPGAVRRVVDIDPYTFL
ncbi:primosomal protein N' [Amphiplicatus metriothermophilus]|nr:primosomal protein N' [Amphiplicatus metriothermophilus]MBB5519132.1 primosomal protein N' (replication factor Y) [Amphiplicatus metriothermophilus]